MSKKTSVLQKLADWKIDLILLIPILYGFFATWINVFLRLNLPSLWFGILSSSLLFYGTLIITIIAILLAISIAIVAKQKTYMRVIRYVLSIGMSIWILWVILIILSFRGSSW